MDHYFPWRQFSYICVSKLTVTGSDDGLSPGQCQAIIWTNTGILLIAPLGTNFSEIWIKIQTFLIRKKYIWKYHQWNGSHFVQGRWVKTNSACRYDDSFLPTQTYHWLIRSSFHHVSWVLPSMLKFLFGQMGNPLSIKYLPGDRFTQPNIMSHYPAISYHTDSNKYGLWHQYNLWQD